MARLRAPAIAGLAAAAAALLVAAILGWGYWHASSHAALHASLYDIALKNERQAYGEVPAADVVFRDAGGSVLAKGKVEAPLGVFFIDHPSAGDCRREEREAALHPGPWKRCFEARSRWLPSWVREVRYADVKVGNCSIARTPVLLEESKDDWWLWWVPSPHIGGAPLTYFHASLWIDAARCRPLAIPR